MNDAPGRRNVGIADFAAQREVMVTTQLRARGITDARVLDAMGCVPREEFVPNRRRAEAYRDAALPIEEGQTISQPYIVALMVRALRLRPDDRVLEIGAGSGYAAAVLARLAGEVYAMERLPALARRTRQRLLDLGLDHIHLRHGDGTLGWPEAAPFDAIIVSASGPELAFPLLSQLAPGGRLVMPVGLTRESQELVRVTRVTVDDFQRDSLGPVQFVPLIGQAGWQEEPGRSGND